MPSKYEFEQIIIKLEEAVKLYKNAPYRYNENKIYLSNGQILEFMFKPQNVPHLLGINIGNLKNSKILIATKPLDMLEELILRYTAIYQKFVRGELSYYDIFSPYVKEKIDSFETILKCDINDIYFVSKYSLSRAYLNGERNNYGCQYYIAFNDGKSNISLLGLKKSEGEYFYSTSSIISSQDEQITNKILRDLIENQQIMMVNCVGKKNINSYNYLKNADKLAMAQSLSNLADKFDSHLILSNDFIYSLKKLMSSYEKELKVQNFISKLILAISKGRKVNVDSSFDQTCSELAETYNIYVQKSSKPDMQEDLEELKKLKAELLLAQQKLTEQERIIADKDKKIKEQENKINSQQAQLDAQQTSIDSLTDFKNEAFQLFKKYQ